jgi:uncharacterized protein (DUF1778 family)
MTARKKTTALVPINMRVDTANRNLIDMAAALLGSERTSFIVDAACRHAEEVLLDNCMFLIDSTAFDAFQSTLESNPVVDNACLMRLMQRPKRWA